MKILLDHNLNWRLSRHIPGHKVESVVRRGWATLENGDLLSTAESEGFEVMLTGDTNVNCHQNFSTRNIAVIILRAPDNKRQTHIEMMPEVNQVLATIQPGQVLEVFHSLMKP